MYMFLNISHTYIDACGMHIACVCVCECGRMTRVEVHEDMCVYILEATLGSSFWSFEEHRRHHEVLTQLDALGDFTLQSEQTRLDSHACPR